MSKLPECYHQMIRSYILDDVISKQPIDKSFKILCGGIGNDAITFYDFQYLYYRFWNGNHDLDFDRSSEPEPLQFSDLPTDIIGMIVDRMDFIGRLSLRKVSKSLQNFIQVPQNLVNSISIRRKTDHIHCTFGDQNVYYTTKELVVGKEKDHFIRNNDYDKDAFEDLQWILSQRNLKFENFYFERIVYGIKKINKIDGIFESINHRISAKNVAIRVEKPSDVLDILQHFQPGVLKSIEVVAAGWPICYSYEKNPQMIEKVVKSEQWKQAQRIELLHALNFFPDESLAHCKVAQIEEFLICSPQDLIRLRDIFAKSENFVQCCFNPLYGFYMWDLQDFADIPDPQNPSIRHYMIPNSNKYLEFRFKQASHLISIEKKTRNV